MNRTKTLLAAISLLVSATPAGAKSDFFDATPKEYGKPSTQPARQSHTVFMPSTDVDEKPAPADRKNISSREFDLTATENGGSEPRKGKLSRLTAGPKKALGVTCGVMVGVPVHIVKDSKKYTKMMHTSATDGVGVETDRVDLFGRMVSAGIALPFGIGSGIVNGSVKGFEQGVHVGGEKPFSKESMGLGKQPEEKQPEVNK